MPHSRSITAIVFEGGQDGHALAAPILRVRSAVTLDTLEKLRSLPEVTQTVVCSDRPEVLDGARRLGLTAIVQPAGVGGPGGEYGAFHFGRWLRKLADDYAGDAVLYLSGASAPLMGAADFAAAVGLLTWGGPRVVANNSQSPDIIGFYPADLLHQVEPPATDNALGLALRDLPVERVLLPTSGRASFDLDTPTDLVIYREVLRAEAANRGQRGPEARSGAGRREAPETRPGAGRRAVPQARLTAGPQVREALDALDWELPHWPAALRRLQKPFADVAIIGRVGAPLLSHLNDNYTLRVRVFSEERGMKALGRESGGQVRTLMGAYIEDVGAERFFRRLAEMAEVALIDTRPLFAQGGRRVEEADRFASDLGLVEEIRDPWVAEFTAAAREAPLPVVLGGHSLVSGGLRALLDYVVNPVGAKASHTDSVPD